MNDLLIAFLFGFWAGGACLCLHISIASLRIRSIWLLTISTLFWVGVFLIDLDDYSENDLK